MTIPAVLTIAGSDSSGGAGIQADLKTMTTLGCFGMSVITALTAQNTQGVRDIHPVPAAFVTAQLDAVCQDIPPSAVKIGMVYDIPQIHAIAAGIQAYGLSPVVVDPVMVATSGASLLERRAQAALEEVLFPLATLITPNLPEAAALLGEPVETLDEMEQAVKALAKRYGVAVLLKGGHLPKSAIDLLCTADGEVHWYSSDRLQNPNTHGTGCTLSSAIASYLAKGKTLVDSIYQAKIYITEAIAAGLDLGKGNGPIYHQCGRESSPHCIHP